MVYGDPSDVRSLAALTATISDLEAQERRVSRQLAALQAEIAALAVSARRLADAVFQADYQQSTSMPEVVSVGEGASCNQVDDRAGAVACTGGAIVPDVAGCVVRSERLTLICGIDAATAARLNAIGIDSFIDLAALTPEDVAEIGRLIGDPRRVSRQGWIEQAALLARGVDTSYARARRRGSIAADGAFGDARAAVWSADPAQPVGAGHDIVGAVHDFVEVRRGRGARSAGPAVSGGFARVAIAAVAALAVVSLPLGSPDSSPVSHAISRATTLCHVATARHATGPEALGCMVLAVRDLAGGRGFVD